MKILIYHEPSERAIRRCEVSVAKLAEALSKMHAVNINERAATVYSEHSLLLGNSHNTTRRYSEGRAMTC